jgi:hypothetical protein
MKVSSKMATKTLTASRFAGLTDDQVRMVFEQIATTVNLMAEICRDKAEAMGEHESALTFHALDTMLRGVGAIADLPTDGNCVGSFSDWMLGPVFNPKEVTAT